MKRTHKNLLLWNLTLITALSMQQVIADETPKRRITVTPTKLGIVTAVDKLYWDVFEQPHADLAQQNLDSAIRKLGLDPKSRRDRLRLADQHVEKNNLIAAVIDLEAAQKIEFDPKIRERILVLRNTIERRQSVPFDQAKRVQATSALSSVPGCGHYLYQMEERVKERWRFKSMFDDHAVLNLKLDRLGRLKDCTIFTSSGVAAIDESALNAVQSAAPFGRLPSTVPSGELDVVLKLKMGVHQHDRTRVSQRFPGGVYMSAREVAEEGHYPLSKAATYSQKMDQMIQSEWAKKKACNSKEIVVLIEIAADGKAQKTSVYKSCGVSRIDNIALQTVHDCAPFPIPPALPKNLTFDMELTFPPRQP